MKTAKQIKEDEVEEAIARDIADKDGFETVPSGRVILRSLDGTVRHALDYDPDFGTNPCGEIFLSSRNGEGPTLSAATHCVFEG